MTSWWNGMEWNTRLGLTASLLAGRTATLGPWVNAKEQRPDSPIFLVLHPHNWTECKFSYFVPTAQRFSGVTLKSGSFHVKDIEELDKVQIYSQMYKISFRTYNKNKLELSWAKLSLAGAMVFGLGIVEFWLRLNFRMVLRSTHWAK